MTVIAAIKENGKVYMGCDSIFMDLESYQTIKRTDSKLIQLDEIIIGITATNGCRVFQIMKYLLKLPPTRKIKNDDLITYMTTTFRARVKKLLIAEDILLVDEDRKSNEPCIMPSEFLVAIRDRIFQVGQDFDIAEIDMPFSTIGSGGEYALGALETMSQFTTLPAEDKLLFAMKTSEKFTASVKGPFHLLNTGEGSCLLECF